MSLYKTLMDLLYDITVTALDLDSNSQNVVPIENYESVGGLRNPAQNFIFYGIQTTDDAINKQVDVIATTGTNEAIAYQKVQYVRNLRFTWHFYGDDGFEWADTMRVRLFDTDIRTMLSDLGITMVTNVPEAFYVPELIGGQWYKRYDLTATFNQLVTRTNELPAIALATVYIETEEGVVAECSV